MDASIQEDQAKRSKAKHGQGGVWPVKKDGRIVRHRWEIMVGYLSDGRKDIRRGSAKTERDAYKAMRQIAVRKDANTLPAASAVKGTIADLVRTYLAAKKVEASAKTYTKEEQFANLHIIPQIGKVKQEKLTASDVRTLLAKLTDEGLAAETVRGIRGTLARALDQAVVDDILPRNVARLERRKRAHRAARTTDDKHWFTPSEVRLILDGSQADRFHVFWTFLLYTGARFGEAAGLMWRDFDAEAGLITISRSLEKTGDGIPIFSDPKTYASRRTLRIPPTLVAALKGVHKAQAQEKLDARRLEANGTITDTYRNHDLIFASKTGTPLMHRNVYESFKRLMKKLDLPTSASPHSFRHTAATNMLHAGVPLNEVSYILGHAGVEVTAKVYSHAIPRGGEIEWTPPPGRRGLYLLEAWYDRSDGASETERGTAAADG